MRLGLIFLATFGGILLVCALLYPIAKWIYALSKWIERKTGNTALAYNVPPVVFISVLMAAAMTCIIALNHPAVR